MNKKILPATPSIEDFLSGKTEHTLQLYHHFVKVFLQVGDISLHPAKTMIGIATPRRRIAWITALGKNFMHIVFPFRQLYEDNLCFQKIAKVPDDNKQFNHHFRMYAVEDVNEEVINFMKLAYKEGL